MNLNYNTIRNIVNRYNIYDFLIDQQENVYHDEIIKIILYFKCRKHPIIYHEMQEMIIILFFERIDNISDEHILNCNYMTNDLYHLL